MGTSASSDRTRRWTWPVRSARARETTRTGSTRHADRSINQSSRTCLRREVPTDHEAHTATRSGDSCGNECRTHSQTELWRDCSREAEADTRRTRVDECTIAGSRAEQSLTKGADPRLRYRPSRQRLQRRGIPSDAQKWTTRGTAESTIMPTTRWLSEL